LTINQTDAGKTTRSVVDTARERFFVWLTRPLDPDDISIRNDLLQTLVVRADTVMFGAVSLALLIGALWTFHAGANAAPLAIGTAAAVALRMATLRAARRAPDSPDAIRHVVESGLIYAAATGTVGMVSALSGHVMLIILTALVMTGLTFGFCIVNAGAPRYVRIQVMLISLPFLLSTSFSGAPDMLILLLQTPFWIGGIFMMINTSHDRLAKLIQAQRTNRYLAFNDMLTGLANRAEIMATLDRLASKPRPRGAPAPYLLYLDLDGFKGVNDRYGHAAGDELLRIVADRLRSTLRNGDTLGRIGGDEFVVLLSDLPRDQLPALAERLTRVIADPFDLSAATGVQIGISIGGAPLDGSDPRQSMALADSMLYTAKAAGRSTYRLSGV